jgi:hypothetical protein
LKSQAEAAQALATPYADGEVSETKFVSKIRCGLPETRFWYAAIPSVEMAYRCRFKSAGGGTRTGFAAFRSFQPQSATSSPPEACSLMRIEHTYNQGFPPFCQAPSLRTNKPSNTHQLLIHHPFTGTFTGTKSNVF